MVFVSRKDDERQHEKGKAHNERECHPFVATGRATMWVQYVVNQSIGFGESCLRFVHVIVELVEEDNVLI